MQCLFSPAIKALVGAPQCHSDNELYNPTIHGVSSKQAPASGSGAGSATSQTPALQPPGYATQPPAQPRFPASPKKPQARSQFGVYLINHKELHSEEATIFLRELDERRQKRMMRSKQFRLK